MLREEKLKKNWLKDGTTLLRGVQAVIDNQAYPSHVYMNPKDYSTLERNIYKQFKKEYPWLSTIKLKTSTGMHLLSFGPITLKAVSPGYVLVDDKGIQSEKEG